MTKGTEEKLQVEYLAQGSASPCVKHTSFMVRGGQKPLLAADRGAGDGRRTLAETEPASKHPRGWGARWSPEAPPPRPQLSSAPGPRSRTRAPCPVPKAHGVSPSLHPLCSVPHAVLRGGATAEGDMQAPFSWGKPHKHHGTTFEGQSGRGRKAGGAGSRVPSLGGGA